MLSSALSGTWRDTHEKNVLKLFVTHVRTMECVPKRRMMAGGQALLYLRPPHVSADPAGIYSNTENPIRLQVSSHTATHHVQGARRAGAETRDSATPHKPDESSYAGSEMKYPTPFEKGASQLQSDQSRVHPSCVYIFCIYIYPMVAIPWTSCRGTIWSFWPVRPSWAPRNRAETSY